MTRVIRIEYRLFTEDSDTPDHEGVVRVPWPDGQTLDEVAMAHLEGICRQLHAPQKVWKLA